MAREKLETGALVNRCGFYVCNVSYIDAAPSASIISRSSLVTVPSADPDIWGFQHAVVLRTWQMHSRASPFSGLIRWAFSRRRA